jgi:hypothetical protein
MDPHRAQKSSRRSSTPFEYFLYTAIIVETALAAVVYKVIFSSAELARFSVYFAIFYFVFLGWAIAQLNMLHREREAAPAEPIEAEPTEAEPGRVELAKVEPASAQDSTQNLEAVLAEGTIAPEDPRPAQGLTAAQLVIILVVFATAVATFSWALRVLR